MTTPHLIQIKTPRLLRVALKLYEALIKEPETWLRSKPWGDEDAIVEDWVCELTLHVVADVEGLLGMVGAAMEPSQDCLERYVVAHAIRLGADLGDLVEAEVSRRVAKALEAYQLEAGWEPAPEAYLKEVPVLTDPESQR